MSSDKRIVFTKENLDSYLRELAKALKKMHGTAMQAEIILIGGAAILANYGFRDMTTDVDAIIRTPSSMKDAINRVGDKFNLPNGWLNADFMRTDSYSPRLIEISTHYKTFSHALTIRTVSAEYLIAMKLRSGRKYKNDLSDVLGILSEHKDQGKPITFDRIDRAVISLYGGWESMPANTRQLIEEILANEHYVQAYAAIREEEKQAKAVLLHFERKYPNAVNESNADDILSRLKAQSEEPQLKTVREQLERIKSETVPARNKKKPQKKEIER